MSQPGIDFMLIGALVLVFTAGFVLVGFTLAHWPEPIIYGDRLTAEFNVAQYARARGHACKSTTLLTTDLFPGQTYYRLDVRCNDSGKVFAWDKRRDGVQIRPIEP